jgi:predicted methyltransferase
MSARVPNLLLLGFAAALAACAAAPKAVPEPPPPPRDAVTAAAIERVLAGEHRSAENRARDQYRHPLDTLLFFGIKPEMTVVEVWPGAGGWYTEVLAPLLAERGKLYAALLPPRPDDAYVTASLKNFNDKLTARADLYGKVEVSSLGPGAFAIAPPGSADMVVTFRNIHNWMNLGFAPEAFAAMFAALKPGGILGVVEHRGDPAKPQDPRAANGYVNEDYAVALIEAAGFQLVARSGINANPKDTKDYEQGVWTLPPSYRLGNRDRAKYAAIGESDRFTLKFRKPGAPEAPGSDPISQKTVPEPR